MEFKYGDEVYKNGLGRGVFVGRDTDGSCGVYFPDIDLGHSLRSNSELNKIVCENGWDGKCCWVHEEDIVPVEVVGDVNDEAVHHPSHYNLHKHECIEEMIALFGIEAVIGFCKCNIHKYRYRAAGKNGEEDLRKADEYMDILMRLEHEKM